jgi:hypothetical protein
MSEAIVEKPDPSNLILLFSSDGLFFMYNQPMAISLETQEIIFAFAVDNKDNFESWGKYELDELQDAFAEYSRIPEEEIDSKAGKRIEKRIRELESGKDQVKELRHEEELAAQQSEDNNDEVEDKPEPQKEIPKQNKQVIIAGITTAIFIVLLVLYYLV